MTRAAVSTFGLAIVLAATAAYAQAPAGGQGRGGGRGPAAPACATLSCDILADWQRTASTLIAIADRMPEDKWGYKSTPGQRTFGEQVVHIATTDVRLIGALGGKTAAPAVDGKQAATKADSMAALRASFAYGEAVIKEFSDQQWTERINGIFLGPSVARLRVIYFDMGHSQDIYGQMAVYLRLNGLVPPASDRSLP
jgi:uncharacterized damage-inducible protein DinB